MNQFYRQRREKAEELANDLEDCMELMIVGSVAYNADAVTSKSDLDLVGVLDFKEADFEEIYEQIGLPIEKDKISYASGGIINTMSITWNHGFEVGLHLWDHSALQNVIDVVSSVPNMVVKVDGYGTNEPQIMYDTQGMERKVHVKHRHLGKDQIREFYPSRLMDDICEDFYTGTQLANLLLNPVVLNGKRLQDSIVECKINLSSLLKRMFDKSTEDKFVEYYSSKSQS